jgi:hypothetical protein
VQWVKKTNQNIERYSYALRLGGGVGKKATGRHDYKVIGEGRVVRGRVRVIRVRHGKDRKGIRGRSTGKGRP